MTLNQLNYVVTIANSSSMNEASKKLFISQPSLSAAIKELEEEIGIELFYRSNRGVKVSPEGEEFIGYARQIVEQYQLIDSRFIQRTKTKKRFCVSMQHYSFAVSAFVDTVKRFELDDYELAVRETKTSEVIDDVKNFRSEIGILYLNDFNQKSLLKIFNDNDLEFHHLCMCGVYVYLAKSHPLASQSTIQLEELSNFPCLSFEQGNHNSFYYSEEVLSTYQYKQLIKANDRATMLNLMRGLNGYTLCSGIYCEELNGFDYIAIKLDTNDQMEIGYIVRKGMKLSSICNQYIKELGKYTEKLL